MRSPLLRKLHYKLTDITNIPITFKLVHVEANYYAEGLVFNLQLFNETCNFIALNCI